MTNERQMDLYPNQGQEVTTAPAASAPKKPRLTLKVKKEAISDLMKQINSGWDPSDATWKVIDSLNLEIREAEGKKGP